MAVVQVREDATELARLRGEVEALRRGLTLMAEAQATQTGMLTAILKATSAPSPKESPTVAALGTLTASLTAQTELLGKVAETLEALPAGIAQEVTTSLWAVLNEPPA